ncbi:MAG: acylphosphatase [Deltaproteobacteria bacterium]|nr:acylphosphatase [Deltaproteobacteria bacterium]
MKPVRAHLIIEGLVQGVFYRANTVEAARRIGVYGFVKNRPDGAVEAVIEGDEEKVNKLIQWCRIGPEIARVEKVTVTWEEYRNEFDDFTALTRYNSY